MRIWIAGLLAALLLIAGCAAPPPLDAGFDEKAVAEEAAELIALANAGDYEGVCALLREDLTSAVDAASLEAAWGPMLAQAGAFKEIAKIRCYGTTDAATGEAYAVALASCRYKGGRLTYTLSFDRSGALVGLYLK